MNQYSIFKSCEVNFVIFKLNINTFIYMGMTKTGKFITSASLSILNIIFVWCVFSPSIVSIRCGYSQNNLLCLYSGRSSRWGRTPPAEMPFALFLYIPTLTFPRDHPTHLRKVPLLPQGFLATPLSPILLYPHHLHS